MTNKTEKSGMASVVSHHGTGAEANWIELVRPLVAMFCEEFMHALATEAAQHLPGQASDVRYPQSDDESYGTSDSALHVESPQAANRYAQGVEDQADQFSEAEMQPLFDPKLPPSATSSFKPTVGIVVTRVHELQDLQQCYPQLHLILVLPDAVRNAGNLRDCQRIIGLREDVPLPMDEYLRNAFGIRYVRIPGGIERIREQLSSWLGKPGSIAAGPGKGPRRHIGNFNGAGGSESKKRHSHYLRPMR